MGNMDIAKWKLKEKIKIAKYRHANNEMAIVDELKMDPRFIKKMLYKLRKGEDYEVANKIAATLLAIAIEGHDSRGYEYNRMLRDMDGQHELAVSLCCRSVVDEVEEEQPDGTKKKVLQCWKCKKETRIKMLFAAEIFTLKLEVLKAQMANDKTLIELIQPPDQSTRVNVADNRNYVAIGGAPMKEIAEMDPYDRESLRLQLEREIHGGPADGKKEER